MKKILFSLGTVAAIIAPVVVVVSCGSTSSEAKINGKTNAEIKAMSVSDFNLFLDKTLNNAQPETKDDYKQVSGGNTIDTKTKVVVEGTTENPEVHFYGSKGDNSVLIKNTTTGIWEAHGVTPFNYAKDNATKPGVNDSTKAPKLTAWWADVANALTARFA